MIKENSFDLLDHLIIIVKNKKLLIGTTLLFMVLFYISIFFLVDKQYDSNAIIIPTQDNSMGGIASMIGDLGNLPFDLGISANADIGMYNTIFSSRTTAEIAIERFNLWKVYKLNNQVPEDVKEARERFLGDLEADEDDNGAYVIKMRTPNPQLSADIVNFLVSYVNDKIIELKIKKSKDNRIFLEERLKEIRERLRTSEDSLKIFQEMSGLLNPEEQFKGIVSAYSILEQELITKQIQQEILTKLMPNDSPQLKKIDLELSAFKEKYEELKNDKKQNSIFIPYASIPNKALYYYRYYREVEINNAILQFVIPLYEQAKVEEQREVPVLQVIDSAIPAEEKSYPPRAIFTLLFGAIVFLIIYAFLLLKQNESVTNSGKVHFIKKNLFKWNVH